MENTRPTISGPAPVRKSSPALSAARARILEYLQGESDATTVTLVAKATGLHANTAREHLDGLVYQGLAERRRSIPAGRGRPSWQYAASRANREPDGRVRAYSELVGALAEHIARGPDPQGEALGVGVAWGRTRANTRVGAQVDGRDASEENSQRARDEVVAVLAELSFDPVVDQDLTTVELRRCPLLDLARQYPDVVCSIHLGLIRGVLTTNGGDQEDAELFPFAETDSCRLQLAVRK